MRECQFCLERAVNHDGICEECGYDQSQRHGDHGLFEFTNVAEPGKEGGQ